MLLLSLLPCFIKDQQKKKEMRKHLKLCRLSLACVSLESCCWEGDRTIIILVHFGTIFRISAVDQPKGYEALRSWLGFSSHWGHRLASSYHPKLEIPMKWSQLDQICVNTDLVWLKTFGLLYCKAHLNFVAVCGSWLGCYSGSTMSTAVTWLQSILI
jgi:hypothetical protein